MKRKSKTKAEDKLGTLEKVYGREVLLEMLGISDRTYYRVRQGQMARPVRKLIDLVYTIQLANKTLL